MLNDQALPNDAKQKSLTPHRQHKLATNLDSSGRRGTRKRSKFSPSIVLLPKTSVGSQIFKTKYQPVTDTVKILVILLRQEACWVFKGEPGLKSEPLSQTT